MDLESKIDVRMPKKNMRSKDQSRQQSVEEDVNITLLVDADAKIK
jgi:hypothetical protein